MIDKITICGTPEQQRRIRALCVKYKQIFNDELDSNPAKIENFDLEVDKKLWYSYKNRGPVRPQSSIKVRPQSSITGARNANRWHHRRKPSVLLLTGHVNAKTKWHMAFLCRLQAT